MAALGPPSGGPGAQTGAGGGGVALRRPAGGSRFGAVLSERWNRVCSTRGCTQELRRGAHFAGAARGRQVGPGRAGAGPGFAARSPGPGGGGGSPPPGGGGQRRGPGPGGGGAPQPGPSPPRREHAGERDPVPRSAASTCGPGAPGRASLGPLPILRGSGRAAGEDRGVKAERALTRGGAAAAGPRSQVRSGKRRPRCAACDAPAAAPAPAPAPAERPAPLLRADFLLLLRSPRRRPRPGPPLSAPRCGLRAPGAAGPRPAPLLPPLPPRPRGKKGGKEERERERKRKRLSTWTCLWSLAKQSSQITAPGGEVTKKKKFLLLFLQTHHCSSFSRIIRGFSLKSHTHKKNLSKSTCCC